MFRYVCVVSGYSISVCYVADMCHGIVQCVCGCSLETTVVVSQCSVVVQ